MIRNIQRSLFNQGCSRRQFSFSSLSPRSLKEITNLPLLAKEDTATIKSIWNEYHAESSKSAVGAHMLPREYQKIKSRAKDCPMFIVPIFKSEDSYILLLSQWQDKLFIMTYLEEYKKSPATAQPWLSMSVFDEFASEKDICLVRTDFMPNVTKKESEVLTRLMRTCYANDELYDNFTRLFNKEPSKFDFEKYLSTFKQEFVNDFISESK